MSANSKPSRAEEFARKISTELKDPNVRMVTAPFHLETVGRMEALVTIARENGHTGVSKSSIMRDATEEYLDKVEAFLREDGE